MDNMENKNFQPLLQAAESCLLKYGFKKSNMDIVAKEAGLSRRTVYRTFSNRDELYAEVFEKHFYKTVFPEVQQKIASLSFEESLIEGSQLTISLVQHDKMLLELMYGSGHDWFQRQLNDHSSTLYRLIISTGLALWGNKLDEARDKNQLNPAVSNEDILSWITDIHYLMIIRKEADPQEHQFRLMQFVLPSLQKP